MLLFVKIGSVREGKAEDSLKEMAFRTLPVAGIHMGPSSGVDEADEPTRVEWAWRVPC